MILTLSWDLFILVVVALVVAYSFILGRSQTLKLIVATYVAILLTQGLGNILARFGGEYDTVLRFLGVPFLTPVLTLTEVVVFVLAILFLMLRGGFDVHYGEGQSAVVSLLTTLLFGFATAALLTSTLFSFVADLPVLSSGIEQSPAIVPLMQQSALVQILVRNQDLWFSLPALLLVGFGFLQKKG